MDETDGWMGGWMRLMGGWVDGCMDETDGWMGAWVDG